MNFLKAIEPYEERLNAYQELKSYSGADTNELRGLVNIFLKYVANPKGDMIPTIGCGACIDKMFQRLVTHREIERQRNVEFINAVTNAQPLYIDTSDAEMIPLGQIDLEDQIKEEEIDKLKAECDKKGIKYHHKAGIKKLTELLNG